ncbi:Glycoprotein-N-acetylgalactosamine 3-beta-galactosyltransferase 1 [Lamellibrachia satsuma]|nr:Glycoprotein-N-acetylgalactosamine 3-beta-galactosyltransferase 1 [Lamellibrachia satsuma]
MERLTISDDQDVITGFLHIFNELANLTASVLTFTGVAASKVWYPPRQLAYPRRGDAMLFRRGVSLLFFVIGFASGFLFSFVFIVGRVSEYPDLVGQSTVGDNEGVLHVQPAADEREEIVVATPEVVKHPMDKSLESDRKDVVRQRAANLSVIPTKDALAGCELIQHDVTWVARKLHRQVRVLCWIMTSPSRLNERARYVRDTWGTRCNVLLFASDYKNASFPTIDISVPNGREHLAMKTAKTFDYIYKHHRDEADWFLKASFMKHKAHVATCDVLTDDDTYVIMENLRHLLEPHNPLEALSFGHHLLGSTKKGFFSGGAGYVISREALNRLAHRPDGRCRDDGPGEDVMIGACLDKLGVKLGDSRDYLGRHRFHPFRLSNHLMGTCPLWYYRHSKYEDTGNADSISDYPVSFHYITGNRMVEFDHFIYRVHVYGIIGGLQSVNPTVAPSSESTKTTVSPSSKLKRTEGPRN